MQGPQGWDEDQELDYSEVVRKREEREMSEPRETGQANTHTSISLLLNPSLTPSLPSPSLPPSLPPHSIQLICLIYSDMLNHLPIW